MILLCATFVVTSLKRQIICPFIVIKNRSFGKLSSLEFLWSTVEIADSIAAISSLDFYNVQFCQKSGNTATMIICTTLAHVRITTFKVFLSPFSSLVLLLSSQSKKTFTYRFRKHEFIPFYNMVYYSFSFIILFSPFNLFPPFWISRYYFYEEIVNAILLSYGIGNKLRRNFMSKILKQHMQKIKTHYIFTSAFHPHTNSKYNRLNQNFQAHAD